MELRLLCDLIPACFPPFHGCVHDDSKVGFRLPGDYLSQRKFIIAWTAHLEVVVSDFSRWTWNEGGGELGLRGSWCLR